jgi:hypothetical protein
LQSRRAVSWTSARWSTNYRNHSLQNKNQGLFVHWILFLWPTGQLTRIIGQRSNEWMLVEYGILSNFLLKTWSRLMLKSLAMKLCIFFEAHLSYIYKGGLVVYDLWMNWWTTFMRRAQVGWYPQICSL